MSWVSSNTKFTRRYGAFSSDATNDKAASLFDSVFSKQKASTSQQAAASSLRTDTRIFTQTVDLTSSKKIELPSSSKSASPSSTTFSSPTASVPDIGIEKSDSSEEEDDEAPPVNSQSSTASLDASLSLVRVDSQSHKLSDESLEESEVAGTSKAGDIKFSRVKKSLKCKITGRSDGYDFIVEDEDMSPEIKRQRSDEPAPVKEDKKASSVESEKVFTLSKQENKPKYMHRWADNEEEEDQEEGDGDDEEEEEEEENEPVNVQPTLNSRPVTRPAATVTRPSYASSSQKSDIIRNVKDANVCLESGKMVDYKQDMNYVLTTLLDKKSTANLKCLSLISLAKKCSAPDFRKFLRSGGLLEKTLKAVSDTSSSSMSLCVSVITYIMARDKACIKYDASTLRMLSVFLKMERPEKTQEYLKYIKLAWEALNMWLSESSTLLETTMQFDFTEETLSPSSLILEALVYICGCNREDEMLKNEILGLGVLQFLVSKVDKISLRLVHEKLDDEPLLLCLHNLERCFRIIETCTFCSKKNQAYLISHRSGALIQTCGRLMSHCHRMIEKLEDPELNVLKNAFNCVKRIAGVLINLSHDNELCSTKLGQMNGFLPLCLSFFTYVAPRYAVDDRRFDILVLVSSLLVNLVERCNSNRRKLIDANVKFYNREKRTVEVVPALKALAQMFVLHDSAARTVDEELDNDLVLEGVSDEEGGGGSGEEAPDDGRLKRKMPIELTEDEMAETVQKAMNKASSHMEDSVVASYVALIIGCLMQQNEESITVVKAEMANGDISGLTAQLQRFLEFMQYMKMRGSSHRSVEHIIELLEDLGK